MTHTKTSYWRFRCPACGIGDEEVGDLVQPDDAYCIVCLEHDGVHVRLKRWEDTGQPRRRRLVAA
jgi:hypothetical protein